MPRKNRELERELMRARFSNRGGKGSHRNYLHPSGLMVTISGGLGDDATRYHEKQVAQKIKEAQQWEDAQK
ncbi:MAG: hypothetical protein FWF96_01480 [Kiritimatiellaeota bacterium]|nr:hypothetical protein [Kiritimatiellota bacterium]